MDSSHAADERIGDALVVVRPFRALRPRKELAEKVASPPYDVLDSDEAREITSNNPLSFLRVVKPEVDLDPSLDIYSESVYQKGADNLFEMVMGGRMLQDEKPMYYFYRQIMGEHSQVGLVATVSAVDYENGMIKKHEFTMPSKEADRVKHIMAQRAQCGPVFLAYPDVTELNELQSRLCKENEVEGDFTSDDGIRHTFWLVKDDDAIDRIRKIFSDIPFLYVADGHHRSAAGAIVAQIMRDGNPDHTGNEEYNFFLAVLFPKSHIKILAYNRAVEDLNSHSSEEFLMMIENDFIITEKVGPEPEDLHHFTMYLGGIWYGLYPRPGSYPVNDLLKSLDASILQDNLLAPILGIDDPRINKRIKFVGGTMGREELEKLVDSGKYKVAFSLYPVSIQQLIDVANSGKVMPPKSTWFEPKLRSGLFIHLIEGPTPARVIKGRD